MHRPAPLSACLAMAALAVAASASPSVASPVILTESGYTSGDHYPLTVQAILTGTDTTLTIDLANLGPASRKASDILTSFYFDVVDPTTGKRPGLAWQSAVGQAYKVTASGTDQPVSWTPQTLTQGSTNPSNLVAVNRGDQGWQFKTFTPPVAVPPTLGFGIGTVGNSGLASKGLNFDGNVVSGAGPGNTMINLGIYSNGGGTGGIVATVGIVDNFLIRNHATFTFQLTGTDVTSLNGFDATWVQGNVMWGFGTAPETVLVPEPGGIAMAAIGGLAWVGWLARRGIRRRAAAAVTARAACRRAT
jgi:hypothetical protein